MCICGMSVVHEQEVPMGQLEMCVSLHEYPVVPWWWLDVCLDS